MKIRRITLVILLLLSALFVADIRYFGGRSSTKQPSIHFDVSSRMREWAVERDESFVHSQADITSLALYGQHGMIELRNGDTDQIVVQATIGADDEEILEQFEVKETRLGSELRYELSEEKTQGLPEVALSLIVEVPAGMEVHIQQNFGRVRVHGFRGFLSLQANFSEVMVGDLQGTADIQSSFSVLDLRKIAGPLTLNDSFSTTKIELVAVDGGYDFDLNVNNGTLKNNAGLQLDVADNSMTGRGQWGEGLHPIVIRSSFGSVTLHLNEK